MILSVMLNICSSNPKTYILNQKPNLDLLTILTKNKKTQVDTFFFKHIIFSYFI